MQVVAKDESIWEEQWAKLFGGLKPEWSSWYEAVQQVHRALRRFTKESECILWAIEHEYESLVERMAKNRPRLVTNPRHRDRLPLYTASQIGNAYVLELASSPPFRLCCFEKSLLKRGTMHFCSTTFPPVLHCHCNDLV